MRCFATLSDRFTRRSVDPEPLSKHGLVEELLKRLCAAGGPTNLNTSLPSGGGQTPDPKSSGRRGTGNEFGTKNKIQMGFAELLLYMYYQSPLQVLLTNSTSLLNCELLSVNN